MIRLINKKHQMFVSNKYELSTKRKFIDAPISKASTNKLTSPRHVHMSMYGYMCPLETSDGPKIGMVKNFSVSNLSKSFVDPSQ